MNPNILAKVEDMEITREQMIRIMRNLPRQQAQEVSTEAGRRRLLEEMIQGELLYLDAIAQQLDEDAEFVETLNEAKRGLLQRYALQKLLGSMQATEDEVKQYYEDNKEMFRTPLQVSARHILVDDEEEAKRIKQEIQDGLDFSLAAEKYSTCPSSECGGELGTFSKGQMVPEFEEVAFSLPIGQVSDLVKTQFGYHLILVDEIIPEGLASLESVEQQIVEKVLENKQGIAFYNKIDELKSRYKVVVNEEALR